MFDPLLREVIQRIAPFTKQRRYASWFADETLMAWFADEGVARGLFLFVRGQRWLALPRDTSISPCCARIGPSPGGRGRMLLLEWRTLD